MHELQSLGLNIAAFAFVGMAIAGLFTEDDPNLPFRIYPILLLGSICLTAVLPELGLLALAFVLLLVILRE